nr:HAD hydrolase-like protein [uncultured Anaeromusa sp.]
MSYCYAVWDIDGTLLRSAKAGLYAFEEAMLLFFKKKTSFDSIPTAGRTDWFIAKTIFERFGYANSSAVERQNFIELYESLLPAHLKARQGLVLPGVKAALSWSQQQPQIKTLLLTGNTRQGSLAKLTHYGLKDFFDFDASIFCDFDEERNELSRRLWLDLQTKSPSLTGQQILIIGDTPHDILCGQAIGAHTAAVATGQYATNELISFKPSAVYKQLPEPEILFAPLQN